MDGVSRPTETPSNDFPESIRPDRFTAVMDLLHQLLLGPLQGGANPSETVAVPIDRPARVTVADGA